MGMFFSLYLLLPGPKLPPADLPESPQSDEPGDTWQIANVSAYYTNLDRSTAVSFYEKYFSRSSFFAIPLLTYRVNHPPEKAKQVFIDTKRSYYLEEIVHPFRESLFVNGFDWKNDVFTSPQSRSQNRLEFANQFWQSKVSLRWFYSSFLTRLSLFWASWGLIYLTVNLWKKEETELMTLLRQKFSDTTK